ncbi:MAG: thiol reductant ABC exporter subunit CydD [Actinomycetota bacterium]|nr:thiol reductant ABC exporter subunit CydD [Actinomycetota bacterium]
MNRELLRQVKPARIFLVCTIALGMLGAVATIAQMVSLSLVVDRVFLAGESLEEVRPLLLLLLGAVVLRSGLLWLREVVAQRGAVRVKNELRERLFAHLMRLGPNYTGSERTGELAATTVEGVERLDAYVGRYLPQMALSVFVPLLIFAYLLSVDPISAVLLLATAPAIPVLMVLVGSHAEKQMQGQWAALSRMSAHFLDVLQGLPTLKIFGRGAAERERVAEVSDEFRESTLKVLRYAFLSGFVLEFIATLSIALVAVALGVRLLIGGISFEAAFLVLLLAPEFFRPLRELGVHRHAGMEGKTSADRILEILDTPEPTSKAPGDTARPLGPLTIEFDNVGYGYPDSERPALSGVDLTLPAGTCTALVGRSGAGKSTLVNLLVRFLDPNSGRITANGVPIDELSVESWRENVALVPQRPYLFYGSVLENIRLARPTATHEEVERAAELAGASEFVERLPRGYDTEVGERGIRLSGGEAQRVAIARAFLKDAPLLVMDESTSSLDPESERLIGDALARLMRDRTVLVIAHRLNTVYRADRIAVLQAGHLVETGTHNELLEHSGPYARLVSTYGRTLA